MLGTPPRRGTMKRLGIVAALIALSVTCSLSSPAEAQVRGVYWTTSGFFGPFNIQGLIPSVPKEKARDVTIPVSMWVIDHPKGLIVFDTGNNVAVSDGQCKKHWAAGNCDFLKPNQKREDVIDAQLKKLGYSTDQVKAVITSHAHLAHIGTIRMFRRPIHVIRRRERNRPGGPERFRADAAGLGEGASAGPRRDST